MSIELILIYVLVFAAVALAVRAVTGMVSDTADKNSTEKLPPLFRIFSAGIFFFGEEAGSLLENAMPGLSGKIKAEIAKAAIPLEIRDVYGASLFFAAAGILIGGVAAFQLPAELPARMFCILVFGCLGLIFPRMYIQKIAEKRMNEILRNLPFAIDLISSSMNAGLDFGAAVRYLLGIGEEDLLRKEFAFFLRDVELGKTRTDALKDMQERVKATEFTRFVSAIAYGMDSGSSIIEIMRIQAEEMRRVKYARAEQQAAKAPIKMIVPMALFVFPSMFIMIFVPIFLRIQDAGILQMIRK